MNAQVLYTKSRHIDIVLGSYLFNDCSLRIMPLCQSCIIIDIVDEPMEKYMCQQCSNAVSNSTYLCTTAFDVLVH